MNTSNDLRKEHSSLHRGSEGIAFFLLLTGALAGDAAMAEKSGPSLTLMIAHAEGSVARTNDVRITVAFRNGGDHDIRVLRCFRPLPVFFRLAITCADGTPKQPTGGGKISLGESDMKYITLGAREFFGFELDLREILTEGLAAGDYTVRLEYGNQYGDNCFRGRLVSNAIHVRIPEGWKRK